MMTRARGLRGALGAQRLVLRICLREVLLIFFFFCLGMFFGMIVSFVYFVLFCLFMGLGTRVYVCVRVCLCLCACVLVYYGLYTLFASKVVKENDDVIVCGD